MVDYKKRKTLKTLAGATAGVVAGGVSTAATAAVFSSDPSRTSTYHELGQIEVSSRIGADSNELEVVIRNTADNNVTITQMTPRVARVARGEFDFSALLEDGPLHLKAGESVSIPMQHTAVNTNASSLSDVLTKSLSMVTDGDSFASVSIVRFGAVA